MTRLGAAGLRPSRGLLLHHAQARRAPPFSPAQDTFEFVPTIGRSEMCAAEDVFLRGQLLPFKPPPPAVSPAAASPSLAQPFQNCGAEYRRCRTGEHRGARGHRRAESLDAYERGAGAASRYWRNKGSVSADYQRLRPVAEAACDARPGPRPAAAGAAPRPPSSLRPKWYVLLFGSVQVPAETDMKSIKSRLHRRGSDSLRADSLGNAKTAAPAAAGGGTTWNWKLLRSLSCKGDVAGAVNAPLRSDGLA